MRVRGTWRFRVGLRNLIDLGKAQPSSRTRQGRPGIWRYGGWPFWLAVPSIDLDFPRLTAIPGELGIGRRHGGSGRPVPRRTGRWAGLPARLR